jgi:hypothetical protein
VSTHLSRGNVQLNLATVGAHQSTELLADTLKGGEAVVLGQSLEEVLDNLGLVGTGNLLELLDDLLLIGNGQGRSAEDGDQLGVGLQGLAEGSDGLGGLVEGSGLGGSSVLEQIKRQKRKFSSSLASVSCGVRLRHFIAERGPSQREGSGQHGDAKKLRHRR